MNANRPFKSQDMIEDSGSDHDELEDTKSDEEKMDDEIDEDGGEEAENIDADDA